MSMAKKVAALRQERSQLYSELRRLQAENEDIRLQCGGMEMTIDELSAEIKVLRDQSVCNRSETEIARSTD